MFKRLVICSIAWLSVLLSTMSISASTVTSNEELLRGLWTTPYRYVETSEEIELGQLLRDAYSNLGMTEITSVKLQRSWNKLLPVLTKSFSRTHCQVIAFDRVDPDIFNVPGYIFASSGLIDALSDDELSAVLCHEFIHMTDSSRAKALQAQIDIGSPETRSSAEPWEVAAFLRGEGSYSQIFDFGIEQTALRFTSVMCRDAGITQGTLIAAWDKLRHSRTVEFDDYMALHGIQSQIWPYLSVLMGSDDSNQTEPNADVGWQLWTIDVSSNPAVVSAQQPISSGYEIGTDVLSHSVAYNPKGRQYWEVDTVTGQKRVLDSRDNLFLEYADLELSPNAKICTLTTQQDIIAFDIAAAKSTWVGVGSVSRISPDGDMVAYAASDSLIVKRLTDFKLVNSKLLDIEGDVTEISWSCDNKKIAFVENAKPNILHLLDIETGHMAEVDTGSRIISLPPWTTQGAIALVAETSGKATHVCYSWPGTGDNLLKEWKTSIDIPDYQRATAFTHLVDENKIELAVVTGSGATPKQISIVNVSTGAVVTRKLPSEISMVGALRFLDASGRLAVTVYEK